MSEVTLNDIRFEDFLDQHAEDNDMALATGAGFVRIAIKLSEGISLSAEECKQVVNAKNYAVSRSLIGVKFK